MFLKFPNKCIMINVDINEGEKASLDATVLGDCSNSVHIQIKEKLLQLTDKRKEMIDKWEDRWEWLRLGKLINYCSNCMAATLTNCISCFTCNVCLCSCYQLLTMSSLRIYATLCNLLIGILISFVQGEIHKYLILNL